MAADQAVLKMEDEVKRVREAMSGVVLLINVIGTNTPSFRISLYYRHIFVLFWIYSSISYILFLQLYAFVLAFPFG